MGGDVLYFGCAPIPSCVSIHAPAWGATFLRFPSSSTSDVSIHAPAWGATDERAVNKSYFQFQSTPPHGGRRGGAVHGRHPGAVSIHAPAWGATWLRWCEDKGLARFQSTPPHGGRRTLRYGVGSARSFQSTPPHGGRHCSAVIARPPFCFNPRPRMGGDGLVGGVSVLDGVSIHAPVWGATAQQKLKSIANMFQSTPPYGGRLHRIHSLAASGVSIHAPVWGATNVRTTQTISTEVSIHAPVWGATASRSSLRKVSGFQSTPPYGGRPKGIYWDSHG